MIERPEFDITKIKREFFILGPTEIVCKPRGFTRWCTLPYPGHPNGCPNFDRRSDCPPGTPYFLDIYNPSVYIASLYFNFGEYVKARRQVHKNWSEKALKNPRHWQSHVRAELRKYINTDLGKPELFEYIPLYSPEAMCVNVHLTCKRAGLQLQWPPQEHTYQVAILAKPLNEIST
jgi:predicted metal-binding protein